MDASLTFSGRRLLPLLAITCAFLACPSPASADVLVSRLADETPTGQAVVYRPAQEAETRPADGVPLSPLPLLALILVVPAEVGQAAAASMNSVVKAPGGNGNGGQPGGGGGPGNGGGIPNGGGPGGGPGSGKGGGGIGTAVIVTEFNPEPASFILAVTGSGAVALATLFRRRFRGRMVM